MSMSAIEKHVTPDFNPEAERAVIEGLLSDEWGGLFPEISQVIESYKYFSTQDLRDIYKSLEALYIAGSPLDYIHIYTHLDSHLLPNGESLLSAMGGPEAINKYVLRDNYISPLSVVSAAKMVADSYHKRLAMASLEKSVQAVAGANGNLKEVIDLEIIQRGEALKQYLSREPQEPVFQLLSLDDIWSAPDPGWLIENVIGAGDIGMIYGKQGSGKTFVLIDLIMSAALGEYWGNRFEAKKPLNIVFSTGEGKRGMKQRTIASIMKYPPEKQKIIKQNLNFLFDVPQLFDGSCELNVSQFITDIKSRLDNVDLVVIDTLHNASSGSNENDNGDAAIVIQNTKLIRDELDCGLLISHHIAKTTGLYRGASAYAGSMDTMIEVASVGAKGNPRVMRCTKGKDFEEWEDVYFSLIPVEESESVIVGWIEGKPDEEGNIGEATKAQELLEIMKANPQRLPASKWGEAIAVSRQQANTILRGLISKGLIERNLQYDSKKPSKSNQWLYSIIRNSI